MTLQNCVSFGRAVRMVDAMPRVSVVMPVFNAATTVERAVASIGAQTWRDWELIAVDDGSSDGTGEILGRCAREDARVRVLRRSHRGVALTANVGLEAATGELVARMDADDVAHPERLAEQVSLLEREPTVGMASCLVDFGGDRVAREGYALHVDWLNGLVVPEEIALNRFVEAPVANPSVLFRRELVERHGAFRDGDFPEDYELWLRWLDAGVRIAKVPRALLTWNDPPTRISRNDARYAPDAFFRMKAEWIARELARVAQGREVYVWGAGRHTRKRASHLAAHGVRIAGYIDVDVKKTGRGLGGTGVPVLSGDALPAPGRLFVLSYVTTRGAREYNEAKLVAQGYVAGRDFLLCA
jgi:glycosyltransferase involved in cell wall biosynthesis